MKALFIFFALLSGLASCVPDEKSNQDSAMNPSDTTSSMPSDAPLSYLALGDSYTIGESVPENERWPVQLSAKLSPLLAPPTIIARTGWTTAELQAGIEAANIKGKTYGAVSLLIGVNNQYRGEGRGYTLDQYRQEFRELLQQAIAFANNRPDRVFVLSIPDYGVTPFAQGSDAEKIARELDAYNQSAQIICAQLKVAFYDITLISREAKQDPGLIANDNLHPSGKMYARWVEAIQLGVQKQFK